MAAVVDTSYGNRTTTGHEWLCGKDTKAFPEWVENVVTRKDSSANLKRCWT
jgi:hypothetical protein